MKDLCRRVATSIARRVLGCELIPLWRLERFPQTEYLRKLLNSMDIDCVFDVGANQGQYRQYLREQVGYTGLIISFEPNPDCYANLERKAAADPLWEVQPIALGDARGHLAFNVMRDSQFSSFLNPTAPTDMGGNVVVKTIEVEVSTLDDAYPELAKRLGFTRPLLKLDTQGYELHVLRGGAASRCHFRAIQAELSNVAIYDGIPGMASATEALKGLGFHLSHVFATNPDHFPVAIDFDAYFIRGESY